MHSSVERCSLQDNNIIPSPRDPAVHALEEMERIKTGRGHHRATLPARIRIFIKVLDHP